MRDGERISQIRGRPQPSGDRCRVGCRQTATGWDGWFRGTLAVNVPGKYTLEVPVPGSTEVLRRDFYIIESNPEIDDRTPDFSYLRDLASPVSELDMALRFSSSMAEILPITSF